MTQAFGNRGTKLSDEEADRYLDGWVQGLRRIPDAHLEQTRKDGLAKGCWTAQQFVEAYESGMNAKMLEIEYHEQRAKLKAARDDCLKPGEPNEARDRMARKRGWIT